MFIFLAVVRSTLGGGFNLEVKSDVEILNLERSFWAKPKLDKPPGCVTTLLDEAGAISPPVGWLRNMGITMLNDLFLVSLLRFKSTHTGMFFITFSLSVFGLEHLVIQPELRVSKLKPRVSNY